MPDKTMIADLYQLTDKGMTLYPAAVADPDIFLYLGKGSYECMIADPAAIEVHRLHYRHGLAEYDVFADTRLIDLYAHRMTKLE